MRGIVHVKMLTATLTLLAMVLTVAWYGWFEPPYLSYKNLPFEPLSEVVVAGQPVKLKVTRCNSTDEEQVYVISRRLVRLDAPAADTPPEAFILNAAAVDIAPGCHDEISAANVPPADTPPGTYYVRGRAKVEGRWRSSYVLWSSKPFKVIAPLVVVVPYVEDKPDTSSLNQQR